MIIKLKQIVSIEALETILGKKPNLLKIYTVRNCLYLYLYFSRDWNHIHNW